MSDISTRAAFQEDTLTISHIINESWRAAYSGIVPDEILLTLSDQERQARLSASLNRISALTYYLLELDGVPIGTSCLHPTQEPGLTNTGAFSFFYLLPDYWGKGYGRHLLLRVEREAQKHGFSTISCWTLAENARAISFYEKNGYHHDGAKQTTNIGKPLEIVRYLKTLNNK